MRIHRGILIRGLAMAIACALTSAAAAAQPAADSAGGRRESVTGTIFRIDSHAGTFDLLTGVGHAVRVRRLRYAAGLSVMARRADVGLPALAPGAVCRVECEVAAHGATASRVEVLYPAPARTP